jgi:hypothetical protein
VDVLHCGFFTAESRVSRVVHSCGLHGGWRPDFGGLNGALDSVDKEWYRSNSGILVLRDSSDECRGGAHDTEPYTIDLHSSSER